MKTTTILRTLIATEITLLAVGVVVDLTTVESLPIEFQRYAKNEIAADLSTTGSVGLGIGMLFLVGIIVGWVGLWRLWRPARMIYTVSWIAAVPIYLMLDPVVWYTPLGALLNAYSTLAAGAIISLLFLTDVSNHFNKPQR